MLRSNGLKKIAFLYFQLCCLPLAIANTCTALTELPIVISKPGHYCLTGNLHNPSEQHAITIATSGVVLDLQNYAIDSGNSDPQNQLMGIHSLNRKDITIKNGTIRGFMYGIYLADSSAFLTGPNSISGGYTIENIILEDNTFRGIRVEGVNSVIKNNKIVNTGGTSLYDHSFTMGIEVIGPGALVEKNTINNVHTEQKGGSIGIAFTNNNIGGQANFNRISNSNKEKNTDKRAQNYGIWVGGNAAYPSNVYVKNNRIKQMDSAIVFAAYTSGWYGNNQIEKSLCPIIIASENVSTFHKTGSAGCRAYYGKINNINYLITNGLINHKKTIPELSSLQLNTTNQLFCGTYCQMLHNFFFIKDNKLINSDSLHS